MIPLVGAVAYGRSVWSHKHVDRVAIDPLAANWNPRLLGRYRSIDDPAIGAQERDGWATYVHVSEPHSMWSCPFSRRWRVRQAIRRAVEAVFKEVGPFAG